MQRYLPSNVVDHHRSLYEGPLNAIPNDFQAHKELQSKCTKDRQRNKNLNNLSWTIKINRHIC